MTTITMTITITISTSTSTSTTPKTTTSYLLYVPRGMRGRAAEFDGVRLYILSIGSSPPRSGILLVQFYMSPTGHTCASGGGRRRPLHILSVKLLAMVVTSLGSHPRSSSRRRGPGEDTGLPVRCSVRTCRALVIRAGFHIQLEH